MVTRIDPRGRRPHAPAPSPGRFEPPPDVAPPAEVPPPAGAASEREPLLYTVDGVCFATNLSRATVAKFLASGELHSIKIGRSRRIPLDSLRRWLAEQPS